MSGIDQSMSLIFCHFLSFWPLPNPFEINHFINYSSGLLQDNTLCGKKWDNSNREGIILLKWPHENYSCPIGRKAKYTHTHQKKKKSALPQRSYPSKFTENFLGTSEKLNALFVLLTVLDSILAEMFLCYF